MSYSDVMSAIFLKNKGSLLKFFIKLSFGIIFKIAIMVSTFAMVDIFN